MEQLRRMNHYKPTFSCNTNYYQQWYSETFPSWHLYLLKVNNENTRRICENLFKAAIKTPKQRHWRRSGVFDINFEQISYIALMFSILTLNKYMKPGGKYLAEFSSDNIKTNHSNNFVLLYLLLLWKGIYRVSRIWRKFLNLLATVII